MSESSDNSTPLLRPLQGSSESENSSRMMPQTTALALLLGRAAGRRRPSMLVRETAARELEERRADWGYSKPVVALDMLWNMVFVLASLVLLICTFDENPNVPIRVWICGYALQCLVHVLLVWVECRRRRRRRSESGSRSESESESVRHGIDNGNLDPEAGLNGSDSNGDDDEGMPIFEGSSQSSFSKRCESVNTMASFLWWIVGFYWVVSGGEQLLQDAPRLYWLTVVYLAFDVFFAIFCVVLVCLIGIALCCCLPCIIALLYTVARQEGASEADLSVLPKYRFQMLNNDEKPGVGAGVMVPVETGSGYVATERVLLSEDAECCICLSSYEDGVELHGLPCNHHFHGTCIVKWLKMNATCPLCKYNIVKGADV